MSEPNILEGPEHEKISTLYRCNREKFYQVCLIPYPPCSNFALFCISIFPIFALFPYILYIIFPFRLIHFQPYHILLFILSTYELYYTHYFFREIGTKVCLSSICPSICMSVCPFVTFLVIVSPPEPLDIATSNFAGAQFTWCRGYLVMFHVTLTQGQRTNNVFCGHCFVWPWLQSNCQRSNNVFFCKCISS